MSKREYRRFLLQGQEVQRFGDNVKYVPVSFAAFQDVETGIIVGDIASFEAWIDSLTPKDEAEELGREMAQIAKAQRTTVELSGGDREIVKEVASGSKRRSGATGSSEG